MEAVTFIFVVWLLAHAYERTKEGWRGERDHHANQIQAANPTWNHRQVRRAANRRAALWWGHEIAAGFPTARTSLAEDWDHIKRMRGEDALAGERRRDVLKDELAARRKQRQDYERAVTCGGTTLPFHRWLDAGCPGVPTNQSGGTTSPNHPVPPTPNHPAPPTPNPGPANTQTPQPTPTPNPGPANTQTPQPTPTPNPGPANTQTPQPTPTPNPGSANTQTPQPTPTPNPGSANTRTPQPTPTPNPGSANTRTPQPTPTPNPGSANTQTPAEPGETPRQPERHLRVVEDPTTDTDAPTAVDPTTNEPATPDASATTADTSEQSDRPVHPDGNTTDGGPEVAVSMENTSIDQARIAAGNLSEEIRRAAGNSETYLNGLIAGQMNNDKVLIQRFSAAQGSTSRAATLWAAVVTLLNSHGQGEEYAKSGKAGSMNFLGRQG